MSETTFTYTSGNLVQTYTAPTTGTYRIIAEGASDSSGSGAEVGGIFTLQQGETLSIVIGGIGVATAGSVGVDVGLGTTVVTETSTGVLPLDTPLLVAAGGGPVGGVSLDIGTPVVALANINPGSGSVVIMPLCFLRGTYILTPQGLVLVEDLAIGDQVVTRFGGIQPIKWIGRQSHAAHAIRNDVNKIPVCIHAGALGDGLPVRDLFISPGHSMLVDGQLLLGRLLVNGVTITQDWCPPIVDYYHLELDRHDCVLAEGAWGESFADAQSMRERFHNAAEFDTLYPDNGPAPDEFQLCAPRPERGPKLEAALRGVVARSSCHVTPGQLQGSIDLIDGAWRIKGWAMDEANPYLPVLLTIELDGQVVGEVLACEERQDLRQAGFGLGRCAFCYTSPIRLRPELLSTLRVRRAADGADLNMHPSCSAHSVPARKYPARTALRLIG